jgi:hypothetical protein
MNKQQKVEEIREFFKKRLDKEFQLINKSEVLNNLDKASDDILLIHGADFKVNPNHAYSCLSAYLKVRTDSIF